MSNQFDQLPSRSQSGGPAVGRRRATSARHGSATLLVLMLLLVMSVLGMATASSNLQALSLARLQQRSAVAYNVAESGADRGMYYIRSQTVAPTNTTAWDPFSGAQTLGVGSYSVTITPNAANNTAPIKYYLVSCVGTYQGRSETVQAYIRTGSLAAYAFLADSWPSGAYIDNGNLIDGAMHINGTNGVPVEMHWSTSATTPIVSNGLFTTGLSSINWQPRGPNTEAEYQKVFQDGTAGYKLGVASIPLPLNTTTQRAAAWPSSSGAYPTTNGLYVPNSGGLTAGGIYMVGDINSVVFRIPTSGGVPQTTQQAIDITQGTNSWTITIDRVANTTTFAKTAGTGSPSSSTYVGQTNGVIYSAGSVLSLQGSLADSAMSGSTVTARNAFTLATDVVGGKNISVTNNILYNTQPSNTEAWDSTTNGRSAALGLVAKEVRIDNSAPNTLTIDAVMACGYQGSNGKFWAPTWSTHAPGTVTVLGGTVANQAGITAAANSSGTIVSGWLDSYIHDRRLRVNPPPHFPPAAVYERLSFQRTAVANN
jgi:hypothetical protein